jgi:hypothetical protein
MSWGTFKSTLLPAMQSNVYGNDISGFAKTFTIAYDLAVKSGGDTINKIPIIKGNTELMENMLVMLLNQTQLSKTTTFLEVIGPAILAYWGGAQLALFPTPLIPAIGSIKNIITVNGSVLSPGNWQSIPTIPNNNSSIFLDTFITSAKIHLTTINGIFSVIAQYPFPAPPSPGIINWSGYYIPD